MEYDTVNKKSPKIQPEITKKKVSVLQRKMEEKWVIKSVKRSFELELGL